MPMNFTQRLFHILFSSQTLIVSLSLFSLMKTPNSRVNHSSHIWRDSDLSGTAATLTISTWLTSRNFQANRFLNEYKKQRGIFSSATEELEEGKLTYSRSTMICSRFSVLCSLVLLINEREIEWFRCEITFSQKRRGAMWYRESLKKAQACGERGERNVAKREEKIFRDVDTGRDWEGKNT